VLIYIFLIPESIPVVSPSASALTMRQPQIKINMAIGVTLT
jgi:hypothetical protein